MILHITTRTEWETAVNTHYTALSLATEGFIHCSTPVQLLLPANQLFRGQTDLILLCIDPDKVTADIVYEDCYESGQQFPHIYGPLNRNAVIQTIPFPPNPDGTFVLPNALISLLLLTNYPKFNLPPILEFDPTPEAIIEPSKVIDPINVPERCVLCFFPDIIQAHREAGHLRQIHRLYSEIGPNPVYMLEHEGQAFAVAHPGVGAPLAAAFLEELIALGCRQFIACGSCGVLDEGMVLGQVVVPETAVRDEGTSYHYLPPDREVAASPAAITAINKVLNRHHIPHISGKTWTTDAIYRETRARMEQRRAEGCLTVEMEAAAFFAVAQFRSITFGQILYGGDNLGGDEWDGRDFIKQSSTREKLFWLAVEACAKL